MSLDREVLVRKNATIVISLLDQNNIIGNSLLKTFYKLYIPFEPDELTIKHYNYYNNIFDIEQEQLLTPAYVYCNITNDNTQPIAVFTGNIYVSNSSLQYTLKKPFPNSLEIYITDFVGNLIQTRHGLLTLMCEFVKYK